MIILHHSYATPNLYSHLQMTVPWPLDVEELKDLLGGVRLKKYRVVHLANATKVRKWIQWPEPLAAPLKHWLPRRS